MPKPSSSLSDEFISHLRALEWTRSKMEKLLGKNEIVRRDIERVYEGLYLDAITSLESLFEDLFIGLLTQRIIQSSLKVKPRVYFKSDKVAREVVLGGRNYVDWVPYHLTEKRAKAFFRNGLPFTSLMKPDKQSLEQILYVRNAIAHRSSHSYRMFEKEVIGSVPLPPRERTPAGYLRSRFRISPVQTRYENLIADMASITIKICG